jgi:hypothetical protein
VIDPKTLREEIIRPTLDLIESKIPKMKRTQEVEDLLVMIAAHESHLGKYRRQAGGGPARGIYQIEVGTYIDLYENYLEYREHYEAVLASFNCPEICDEREVELNDIYATVVARFLFWRVPEPFPRLSSYDCRDSYLYALARYAKTHWNTEAGAATPEKYLEDYLRLTS